MNMVTATRHARSDSTAAASRRVARRATGVGAVCSLVLALVGAATLPWRPALAAAASTPAAPTPRILPSISPPDCWLADGTQVLVGFVSDTGYTRALAETVAGGAAAVPGTCVWLLDARAAPVDMLPQADAVLVGAPVHNGNPASAMLEWIERWPFHGAPLRDRVGGVFVTGGGLHAGAESSLLALQRSLLSFSMLVVGGDAWQSAYGVAATSAEAPFASKALDAAFLAKARALGRRVASLAVRMAGLPPASAATVGAPAAPADGR